MPAVRSVPRRRLLVAAGLTALLQSLLALVAVAAAAPASAHATLVSTDPADGAVLAEAPDAVTLTFDERVALTSNSVGVYDAAGDAVEAEASGSDEEISVDLPDELADGTYVVTFRVVSADGHPVAGSLTFSVGAPSETVVPPDAAGSDPPASVRTALGIAQGAGYLGLLLAAGLALFRAWALRGTRLPDAVRDRVTRLHVAAAALAVLAWAASVPLNGAYQQGLGLDGAVTAEAVSADLVVDDLVVVVMVALGIGLALTVHRWPQLAVGGAGFALLAPPLVGHTRAYEPASLLLVSDIVHLGAGAVWLGGLVGLVLTLPALSGRPRSAVEVLTRFSTAAAGALGALAVTGTLLGWRILGSWSALFGTTYGVLLMVKVGLVAVVAAVAAANRFRLLPRTLDAVGHDATVRAGHQVRRAVRVEALVVVAVLGVTGFLTNQPPREERAPEGVGATGGVQQAAVDDHRALVTLAPGRRGRNTLTLQVQDRTGEPLELYAAPEVSVSGVGVDLGVLELRPVGAGTYAADVVLPAPGTWEAQVSLRLTEFDNPVTTVQLPVE